MRTARFLAYASVLLMILAMPIPSASGVTNPNPTLTMRIDITNDTWVDQGSPSTNHCSNTILEVTKSAASITKRAFVRFPVTDIPPGATVIGAKMGLTYLSTQITEGTGFWNLRLKRVTASWTCASMDWNNQPAFSTIVESAVVSNHTQTFQQPYFFDVLYAVSQWRASLWSNFGLAITWDSDTSNPLDEADFRASSASGGSPFVEVQYQLPTATIYPAYYCSGGPCETGILSGSGLPAYLFNITYAENNGTFRRAPRPDILLTNISTYYTLRVADFFGNILVTQSKVVTSNPFMWIVDIPYGIFQTYNMRDTFTSLSIKPSGGTAMLIDIPPRAWWVLPLKTGVSYWINFTLLDSNFATVATIDIVRMMGSKLSYVVNGTTLQQVSQNVNGGWTVANETKGLLAGVGSVLLAPKGLNFFQGITGLPLFLLGGVPLGTNIWTILLAFIIGGWVAWFKVYKVSGKNPRRWPKRAQMWFSFVLMPSSFVLFLTAILAMSIGWQYVTVPFPISNV